MDYRDMLNHFGPRGLICSHCYALSEGEIKFLSARLEHLLGNFERHAEGFSIFTPVFAN
jgi:hypothetical protein